MESLCGKRRVALDRPALLCRLAGARDVLVDLGAGDGRFVRHVARAEPASFAIGVDACREGLREASRRAPGNALYLIADALALPPDLAGVATRVTINFPWGSLLAGLLAGEATLLDGLRAIARPDAGAALDVRLNDSALAAAGSSLEAGGARVWEVLRAAGFAPEPCRTLDAAALRACPTTWAKRLAHGGTGRALHLRGHIYTL